VRLSALLSVPHAGEKAPPEVKDISILSREDARADGDVGAAAIFHPLRNDVFEFLTTDIARAYVDLNRAPDDFRPDGVIKSHTCWDVPIYRTPPTAEEIALLLDRYYRPYHSELSIRARGIRVGIDGHTMAASGPPIGPDPGQPRPDLCLSNADGTCPQAWIERFAFRLEQALGIEVSLNFPFQGGYILRRRYGDIPWIQVEFSRAPFLSDREKSRGFRQALRTWMKDLDEYF